MAMAGVFERELVASSHVESCQDALNFSAKFGCEVLDVGGILRECALFSFREGVSAGSGVDEKSGGQCSALSKMARR